MMGLLFALLAPFAFLIPFIFFVSFDSLCGWQESIFKILNSSRNRPVRFIFFAALLWLIILRLRIHTLRLPPIWHRSLLFVVCVYTFVFFNPGQAVSNAKANEPVYCPDGMAYSVGGGHYIRCEDFDLFHEELHNGKTRADLYIGGK